MSITWKSKTDRKWAHHLQDKAWEAEFDAEKTRIIQQAAAMKDNGDIWDLAKSMQTFCRDCEFWYTSSFSNMTLKLERAFMWGFLEDEDLSGFTENTQKEMRESIEFARKNRRHEEEEEG